MRLIFIISIITVSINSYCDMTGAGDAAILGELMTQTEKLLEQVKATKETLDVSKRLEEMEQLKAIRAISNEGLALNEIINNINELGDISEDIQRGPYGVNSTTNELEDLSEKINGVENKRDYANLAADLRRLRFLGKANTASMQKTAGGSNEADDNKSTATNTMIMSNILIENEKRKTLRKAHESSALKDTIFSNSYSNIYGDNHEDVD